MISGDGTTESLPRRRLKPQQAIVIMDGFPLSPEEHGGWVGVEEGKGREGKGREWMEVSWCGTDAGGG